MSLNEKLPPIDLGGMQKAVVLSSTNLLEANESTVYNVSGSKHYLPSKQSLNPGQDTCTGTIETWPAHASKSVSSLKFTKGKAAMKDRTPKPKFLTGLEAYAKRELYLLRCHNDEEPNELRLQAFREVFEYLIEDFKTYKPLLSQIKNEYERNLSHLRQNIRELEPLKSMLVTVSEKCEKKIQEMRQAEQHEIKELQQNKIELMEIIDHHRQNELSLNDQVARLQEELASEYKRYRNEHEMRKMLLTDINNLRSQQEDLKKSTGQVTVDPKDDPVALKISLKCARNDLAECLDELNKMRANYNDVLPRRDFESLRADHEMLLIETKNLKTEYAKLHAEHKTLLQVHEEVLNDRDEIYTECQELKGSATPRPQWEDCLDVLPVQEEEWHKMMKEMSSKSLLTAVMEEFQKGGGGGGGNFTGRGVDETVPKYLRFEGTVKNRFMTQVELSNLMKEIWAAKAKNDGELGRKQDMSEFLYDFFMRKFNNAKEIAAEWAYSMHYTLEKLHQEPNVSFLKDVLDGTANEEFYYHHMEVIKNLMVSLRRVDRDNLGVVSPMDFIEAIEASYPLKDRQKAEALQHACLEELKETKNSSLIKYMDLFTEDEEGRTGPFLNLLRKQENEEIQHYVKDVEEQLNGTDPVGMLLLREAFMIVTPSINETEMNQQLRLAFRCSPDVELDDVEPIPLQTLITNLPKSGIYRLHDH